MTVSSPPTLTQSLFKSAAPGVRRRGPDHLPTRLSRSPIRMPTEHEESSTATLEESTGELWHRRRKSHPQRAPLRRSSQNGFDVLGLQTALVRERKNTAQGASFRHRIVTRRPLMSILRPRSFFGSRWVGQAPERQGPGRRCGGRPLPTGRLQRHAPGRQHIDDIRACGAPTMQPRRIGGVPLWTDSWLE